ncbi:unnamed protein product [Triticum turgidum subsp. durum]|uniref:Cyclin-dependent kinase inhibitor domain-containing protein n=1 Tax=Triticum turgidum subsp. durum TaxID=4567 RepID=A0A9R1S8D4_TRITD|nr:unnamed protein product [Triticum turgidum subsp. durum]
MVCRAKKANKGRSPPTEEMEAFFAAAEGDFARRFTAKYNYDVVAYAPMDGHQQAPMLRLTSSTSTSASTTRPVAASSPSTSPSGRPSSCTWGGGSTTRPTCKGRWSIALAVLTVGFSPLSYPTDSSPLLISHALCGKSYDGLGAMEISALAIKSWTCCHLGLIISLLLSWLLRTKNSNPPK